MKIGEIEKGIKKPELYTQGKYNFALKMEVGDSFLIETTDRMKANNVSVAIRNLCVRGNMGDRRFSTKRVEKGWRIWRIT